VPHITIADAVAAEYEDIRLLCANVIEAHVTREPQLLADTVANVNKNLAVWLNEPHRCIHLVARSAGRVVGATLVKDLQNLCTLFVATGLQRQGIGQRLLSEVSSRCRSQGGGGLLVLNAAPDAVPFYRKLGFTERVATRPLPPGFVPMQRSLA